MTVKNPRKKTNKMHRGQKWIRMDKYVPTELHCVECELPSYRGLPPFIAVERTTKVEGKSVRKRLYRHEACPDKPKDIAKLIKNDREARATAIERAFSADRSSHRNRRYSPPRG